MGVRPRNHASGRTRQPHVQPGHVKNRPPLPPQNPLTPIYGRALFGARFSMEINYDTRKERRRAGG